MENVAKHQQSKQPRWVAGPLYWFVRLKFALFGDSFADTITVNDALCFSPGDVVTISGGTGEDSFVEIVSVDSATTFTVRNIAWYKRSYWWWCRLWYETFPYLSPRFVPV